MPDILAHYAVSVLIGSRVIRLRDSLLLALVGILPDVDILFKVHRWFTHSLVIVAAVFALTVVATCYVRRELLKYVAVSAVLYTLHVALDALTAPTPLLWPVITEAYMLNVGLNGIVGQGGIALNPDLRIVVEPSDFTTRPSIEGPLITSTGVITALTTAVVLVIECSRARTR